MTYTILVCLDGTEFAERVLPYALIEARKSRSKIVLIHVCARDIRMYSTPLPGQPGLLPFDVLDRNASDCEARAREYLGTIAARIAAQGIDAECVVRHGLAAYISDIIVDCAIDNDVDLIAMATHGYRGWKRLVLGSVTASVTKKSGIPSIVVKPDGHAYRDRLEETAEDSLILSPG
jgi:nucleotide-binding universal stress UspA family protein